MKKKLIILFGILLLIPFTLAELEINRLKVYVSGVREITLEDITTDTDGGIIENVQAGDIIEYQLRLKNTWNETIKNIGITAIIEDIDDGDNLKETISDFDLEYEEEVTKKITFTVPAEVRVDDYYSIIEITGEVSNYSNPDFSIEFDIDVISGEKEKVSLIDILGNMSGICTKCIENTKTGDIYRDEIENLKYIKGGLEAERDAYKIDLDTYKEEKTTWENEKAQYVKKTECDEDIKKAKEESNWIFPVGIFGVWWFFIRKKKEKEEETIDKESEDERFKKY